MQKTQESDQDSKKKRKERNTKKVYQTDFSKNYKCVNSTKKSNYITLQTFQQRCYTLCDELKNINNSEKISNVSKRNCRFSANNVLIK